MGYIERKQQKMQTILATSKSSCAGNNVLLVDKFIGSAFDDVKKVADNLAEILESNQNVEEVKVLLDEMNESLSGFFSVWLGSVE